MNETIAAISTAPAPGGIGIVRISGTGARSVADCIFHGVSGKRVAEMAGYTALYGHIMDGDEVVDEAIALCFAAPKSYTGEDVVELSCHGGLYVTRAVLRLALANGARLAEAGEFTRRAFENGKLDLTSAEAVMNLISARGRQAARAAVSAHEGSLSRELNEIKEQLVSTAAWLGAWADFPEEEIPEVDSKTLLAQVSAARERIQRLVRGFDRGRVMREGVDTVIAGRTNVGKSTLMNLLCGQESSIVTDIAGTTRDVVTEEIMLGDVRLKLSDTAGLRDTGDRVEQFGIERARKRIETAELIFAVFDRSAPLSAEDRELLRLCRGRAVIGILNKSDLETRVEEAEVRESIADVITVSAREKSAYAQIRQAVIRLLDVTDFDPTAAMLSSERQLDCARRALDSLTDCQQAITDGVTLDAVSVCIDDALAAIMELTGERVTDRVADSVFHHFCVGK